MKGEQKLGKKTVKLFLAAILFIGIFQLTAVADVSAKSIGDLQKEKSQVNQKHKEVKSDLDEAKDRLNEINKNRKIHKVKSINWMKKHRIHRARLIKKLKS